MISTQYTANATNTYVYEIPNVKGIRNQIVITLKVWKQRIQTRSHLKNVEDYRLEDIGITREQAEQEIAKPFWVK